MASLLLIEDDQKIGSLLASALSANGHDARWQRTGASALIAARERHFDLILLDLGLPDLDGVDLCRDLKRLQPQCVVTVLTARRDEMDVIVALESGADDYLTKPFRVTELLARIRAHLRRSSVNVPESAVPYESGDLLVDLGARRCLVSGLEVSLRPKEFDLLARLVSAAGTAVTRESLMADVWDANWRGPTKTLDVHVALLRRRLSEAADRGGSTARVPSITTLRGYGYRLDTL